MKRAESQSSVTVFCSSGSLSPLLMAEFKMLGEWLGTESIELVYGGTATGGMGVLAQACLEAGGRVRGVVPESFTELPKIEHPNHSYTLVNSLAERKDQMIQMSDVIVVAPGGLGTLDEFTDALTLKALGQVEGRIIVHNPLDYWSPFLDFLEELSHRGALPRNFRDHFATSQQFQDLIEMIKSR